MGNVVSEGRTVLFVSHNMAAVSALCTRGLLIDAGHLEFSGPPQEVIERYLSRSRADASIPVAARQDRKGDGRLRFTRISILNERGEAVDTVISGQDMSVVLEYDITGPESLHNAVIQIKFFGALGQLLFACSTRAAVTESLTLAAGTYISCRIPRLPLRSGSYTFTIWCTVNENLEDSVSEAGMVSVVEGDFFGTGKYPSRDTGDFLVAHEWSVDGRRIS